MKLKYSKKFILIVSINIVLLLAIAISVTYAYFISSLSSNEATISLTGGNLSIGMSSTYEEGDLLPINAGSEDTSEHAFRHNFSVQRSNDSTLGACYDIKMTITNISDSLVSNTCTNGDNLINCGQFIKYKVQNLSDSTSVTGTFQNISSAQAITTTIFANQKIGKNQAAAKNYKMTVWLENDPNTSINQYPMLESDPLQIAGYLSVVGTSCDYVANVSDSSYVVYGANGEHGSVTSSRVVEYGGTTTMTVTPDYSYKLATATCTNGYTTNAVLNSMDSQTVTISNNNNASESTCTFTFDKVSNYANYVEYSNSNYTDCETVYCALNELRSKF